MSGGVMRSWRGAAAFVRRSVWWGAAMFGGLGRRHARLTAQCFLPPALKPPHPHPHSRLHPHAHPHLHTHPHPKNTPTSSPPIHLHTPLPITFTHIVTLPKGLGGCG